jgi:hypothetical protein
MDRSRLGRRSLDQKSPENVVIARRLSGYAEAAAGGTGGIVRQPRRPQNDQRTINRRRIRRPAASRRGANG